MKKYSYGEIKRVTKERVNDRFGDAFLITAIPLITVFIISLFTNRITALLPVEAELITNHILSRIIGIAGSFVTFVMIVRFARGRNGFNLSGIFNDTNKMVQFFIYRILLSFVSLLTLLPMYDIIINVYPTIVSTNDPQTLHSYLTNYITNNPDFMNSIYTTLILFFIWSLITVKFIFAPYLIVDKNTTAFDAIKHSWMLTKGNYFRVFFFPFIFFAWYLLAIISCGIGIIYFLPLLNTAQAYLYLHVLKENQENSEAETDNIYISPIEEDPLDINY